MATDGNSSTQSIGFKNTLGYKTDIGRSRFRIDTLRTAKSDDPYLQVDSGLSIPAGGTLTNPPTHEVHPPSEPDIARYFAEGRYERNLARRKTATWNAGASWDRNEDAGILNRYIAFGGLGDTWVDREDLAFRTTYGLSYTDREEETVDPEKERRFGGVRLTSDFKDMWGKVTTYDNDFTFNVSFKDVQDFNVDLTQGLSVAMGKRLSLKISLQFLYAGEPALEDVDVIARFRVVDPDGIPGNGGETFETIDSGGNELTIGEDNIRKMNLDTTFRTSLLITF